MNIPFDPGFSAGARNAVDVCLRIQPHEKETIITDLETSGIAASMAHRLRELNILFNLFLLEELAPRPLTDMPRAVLDDLETSHVSIFAAQAQMGELGSRMQMTDIVNRRKIRHAHMVNITPQIMREGMRADYNAVDALSLKVLEITRRAKVIRAKTPAGTDLAADMNPEYKWLKTSGIISENTWGNLPGGEVWTTPGEVNGVFVCDGVVGDYLCAKYGDLKPAPTKTSDNRLTRSLSRPPMEASSSPTGKRSPSIWRITPGATISAAG